MAGGRFIGVHSSSASGHKGTQKRYWFAWDSGDEGYHVQALSKGFQPRGEALVIDPVTFAAGFSLEPTILAVPLHRGGPRDAGSPLSLKTAEQEAAEGTELENRLRTHFTELLAKIRSGVDVQGALKALREIAHREEGIGPEHKFMFTEFGIHLRKGKLPEAALEHARRVLVLAPDDGNAHFNIARIYYTLGKLREAEQHLSSALEFAPDLEYARDFLRYIEKERKHKEPRSHRGQAR